jgi:hypothetical protein
MPNSRPMTWNPVPPIPEAFEIHSKSEMFTGAEIERLIAAADAYRKADNAYKLAFSAWIQAMDRLSEDDYANSQEFKRYHSVCRLKLEAEYNVKDILDGVPETDVTKEPNEHI